MRRSKNDPKNTHIERLSRVTVQGRFPRHRRALQLGSRNILRHVFGLGEEKPSPLKGHGGEGEEDGPSDTGKDDYDHDGCPTPQHATQGPPSPPTNQEESHPSTVPTKGIIGSVAFDKTINDLDLAELGGWGTLYQRIQCPRDWDRSEERGKSGAHANVQRLVNMETPASGSTDSTYHSQAGQSPPPAPRYLPRAWQDAEETLSPVRSNTPIALTDGSDGVGKISVAALTFTASIS
ncbi:hypothetical protein BDM02DRAFT_3131133 [Thelephora ganbajun]|uniref:Uncharacterized protein n=1 Tax=Thelephora ganbajun TaxID=370292 RepID=A0ACB6Z756_THEGA|nr:hypothetical protein BDM02DRAFT_3131133 [Thelephora ganbajun]